MVSSKGEFVRRRPGHALALASEHAAATRDANAPAAWGEGPVVAVPPGDVASWFADHAARTPQALAVRDGESTIDYATLAAQAERVADGLRARGIGRDDVVALGLDRSLEFVVAMLGVLRAGAAFLPLDIGHPAERLAWIVGDAKAAVVLTRGRDAVEFDEVPTLSIDALTDVREPDAGRETTRASGVSPPPQGAQVPQAPDPQALAYVIYTSGSTGTPKGVEIQHAAFANVVAWHANELGIVAGTRTSQLAGAGFDASMLEWWGALTQGGSVHIVDEDVRVSPPALVAWLAAEAIEVAFLPTPLAEPMWNEAWPAPLALRCVFVGGDALRHVPPAGLPFAVFNDYGPTEAAVVCTFEAVRPGQARVPGIGAPLPNLRVRIVAAEGRVTAVDAVGELQVGGVGLARGYRHQPGLTAERFVTDAEGGRWYRTGDRASWNADGTLRFLGRQDDQVKLRGFRIELGEVQAALARIAGVRRAAVRLVGNDADRRLAGFVEAESLAPDAAQAQLACWLPAYMVPSTVHVLDALPLDRNGKVDGTALDALAQAAATTTFVAPATATERRLAVLWSELFLRDVAGIGADAKFFAIGGHSLLLVRLISAVRHAFGVALPLKTLFEAADLRAMAALVDAACAEAANAQAPAEELEW